MKLINMQKGNDNPFYGKKDLLNLYHVCSTQGVHEKNLTVALRSAYSSLKTKEDYELFYTLLFAMGDVPNREHNMFKGSKVEGGGLGQRDAFVVAMEWMKKNDYPQYERFLMSNLFVQYTGLFNILNSQVRTTKGTDKVEKVINMLDGVNLDSLALYIGGLIKSSSPVEKVLLAKWLVYPRTSKRQKRKKSTKELVTGGRPLKEETVKVMKVRSDFYEKLSNVMGWEVIRHKHNLEFRGLRKWKQEWNGDLESVLFSTGKIREFDKEQFFRWLDILPAGARYRVRRRVLDKDNKVKEKWALNNTGVYIGTLFLQWESFKKEKQSEERVLTEKVRQGTASVKEKEKLEQVKKEAKVTTGGASLFDILTRMIRQLSSLDEASLLADALLTKVDFKVPVLVIADSSGSMFMRDGGLPILMTRLLATLVMLKNPSTELNNILVRFGTSADFLTDNIKIHVKNNRFLASELRGVEKLVDRKESFIENYKRIYKVLSTDMGGTHFDTVSHVFKNWLDSSEDEATKKVRIEMIQSYPVFLVVSDGDFNGQVSASQVMAQFQQNMKQWFGWEGVVVLWDVTTQSRSSFEGMQNVIHVKDGFNASTVNQIFTKIHDMDVIDVYTPLKSLYASERYAPVRSNTVFGGSM